MDQPGVGDPAPDAKVLDVSGEVVALSELWAGGATALVFLRHFG